MSNLKYAIVEEEVVTANMNSVADEQHPKPFVVSKSAPANDFTRRVQAALDADFAHGSMPA